jgi:O-antigen/teichoic acid export membrane protein
VRLATGALAFVTTGLDDSTSASLDRRTLAQAITRRAGGRLGLEIVGRGLHFVLLYAAQRILGPGRYGELTYAMAMGFVLATLTDLGLHIVVTRQVAREPERATTIIAAAFWLKLLLTGLAVIVLAALVTTRPAGTQWSAFVWGSAMLCSSFAEFFGFALRGFERIRDEAMLLMAMRLIVVAVGFWTLFNNLGVGGLGAAYLMGGVATALLGHAWLRVPIFTVRVTDARVLAGALLRAALPLGGATVLSIAYTRTAIFLLDAYQDSAVVGVYGMAMRLIEPLSLVPAALMAAVFPAVVSRERHEATTATWLRRHSVLILAATGFAVALAGIALGPTLIWLLYGDQYSGAEIVFSILAVASLPVFVNYALTHFLIAADRQHLNLVFNAVIFALNLFLCLLLIPRWGAGGAAGAVLASELALLALCSMALRSRVRTNAEQSLT